MDILRQSVLAHKPHKTGETIIVQWDPERSPRIGRLDYRSLQVGIPRSLTEKWACEWIESIEDVTETARKLKARLDEDPNVSNGELLKAGLLPDERPYDVPTDIRESLEMD